MALDTQFTLVVCSLAGVWALAIVAQLVSDAREARRIRKIMSRGEIDG